MIKGFTCGAFDLVHAGHALMFAECKDYCDYLIVGLQIDPSLDRADKKKPIMDVLERRILLSSNKYIDKVIEYGTEKDLYRYLHENPDKIDIRIIGADWKCKDFTGCDLPMKYVFNTRNHNFSTSELRMRIKNAN